MKRKIITIEVETKATNAQVKRYYKNVDIIM